MHMEQVARQRRTQGHFEQALKGRQPAQDHDRAARFGSRRPPFEIRNAAGLLSTALLLSAVLPGPVRGARSPTSTGNVRPAGLPGAQAAPGSGYDVVSMTEPLEQAANGAIAGCIAHPLHCRSILLGATLGGLSGMALGAWFVRAAGDAPATCLDGDDPPDVPRHAALTATSEVTPPRHNVTVDAEARGPERFQLDDLDPAQDPCRSLYDYVNGRWANASRLTTPLGRWHITDALHEQALQQQRVLAEQFAELETPTPVQRVIADLWSSGMDAVHINHDALRPLRIELAAIDALNSTASIAAHLRGLTAEGRNPVFAFTVEPDMDNPGTLMAYAHQAGLGLSDPGDYLDARRNDVRQAYSAHIARLLEISGVEPGQARADASAVFALEQRLAAASVDREALRDDVRLFYQPSRVADADALTPNIRWSTLFETLGVPTPAYFSLAMPQFHQTVDAALADTPPAVWRAYLRFHCLDMASPYLGDEVTAAAHTFQQQLFSQELPLPPRWKRVLAAIDAFAGEAMSEVYAAAHFAPASRARIEQMVAQIRTVLKRRLGNVPWMDEATRVTAQAKAEQLEPRIGHGGLWPDWSGLRTGRCGFLGNLQRARAYQTRARFARIGQPVDGRHAPLLAHHANAYFDVMRNDMAFSAALLQPPYFDPDADDPLNYGALGVTIGHEMAHAFSAETSGFGLSGRQQQWWSRPDLNRYADIVQRLSRQFDQERVDGLRVNGTLTANENMADLGGLVLALDALREQTGAQPDPMIDGLSREQRFFISWALINRRLQTRRRLRLELQADPHALGAPRANVGPSNLPAFAEAFQCAVGRALARTEHDRAVYL